MKLGDGKKVVVAPATEHITPLDAFVPCEDVAIGAIPPERALEEIGDLYQLAGDRIAIARTPHGAPTFTLRPRGSVVLAVEDRGEGMYLRFHDGIAVEGWVSKSALGPITSLSGYGCSGCGIGHGRTDGGPPGRAARDAAALHAAAHR